MTTNEPLWLKKVHDTELRSWLEADSDQPRELIVDAMFSKRQIVVAPPRLGGSAQKSARPAVDPNREPALIDLEHRLSNIDGVVKTRIILVSGAIVVKATANAIEQIANRPEVKSIRVYGSI